MLPTLSGMKPDDTWKCFMVCNTGPLQKKLAKNTLNMRSQLLKFCVLVLLPFIFTASKSATAAVRLPLTYEDDEIYMRIVLRTPEQLTGFYFGRKFKQAAIDEILKTCYITPIIKNKKFDALWLELDNWEFYLETKMDNEADNKPIKRIKRDYWEKIWRKVSLPMAHQSTFGWTLMPEARDLRFDESVGGSIVLPMQSKPFTLKANYKTGMNKLGKTKTVVFKGISCGI